jgi:phospholipase C
MRHTAVGAGALTAGRGLLSRTLYAADLPDPAQSGIDHVIVVMMENRSFDHYLGWMKKADGRQAGLVYQDASGVSHATHPLAPDYQGCGHPDPDHSYTGARVEYNGGACDGWLRAGENDDYAIGYYTESDLPFLAGAAQDWVTCDRYFASILAPTFPNRFYMHCAQTDRLDNSTALSTLPTIWDLLATGGVDGRYYFSDVPFLAFWGAKYLPIARPFAAFLSDCAAGTLPQVAFVDPRFTGEEQGLSNDDHPHADIRNGEAFLNQVYEAVTASPAWPNTLLVVNYDEWGGFFDHVPPPAGPIPAADITAGNTDGLFGFRVPAIVISPFGAKKDVSHAVLDHTSILRMIEWRWNLPALTVRDQSASNLAGILEFKNKRVAAPPRYRVPGSQAITACLPLASLAEGEWSGLAAVARAWGWAI